MDAIKITKESLDAFKKEKDLIPAPVDGKNVCTDWVEDIFDFQSCFYDNNQAMGFVGHRPMLSTWEDNIIKWKFFDDSAIENTSALTILRTRLEERDEINSEVRTVYEIVGNAYVQKFYWKDEE